MLDSELRRVAGAESDVPGRPDGPRVEYLTLQWEERSELEVGAVDVLMPSPEKGVGAKRCVVNEMKEWGWVIVHKLLNGGECVNVPVLQ